MGSEERPTERAATTEEMAALVMKLVRALERADPSSELPGKALDYLRRKGLIAGPFRNGATATGSPEATGPALVPPAPGRAWHWLQLPGQAPFPAMWEGDHWSVHGLFCDRFEAVRRGYRYVAICPEPQA